MIKIETRQDLSKYFNLSFKIMNYVLYREKVENYYRSFEILKSNGDNRRIDSPIGYLKEMQEKIANKILNELITRQSTSTKIIYNKNVHGYIKDKSFITNAFQHKRKKVVFNVDIKDFFLTINFGRVRGYFMKNKMFEFGEQAATTISQLVCFNNSLPQGAPTSPLIANLIFEIIDVKIKDVSKKYRLNYTRYADDLTFSTNDFNFYNRKDSFLKELSSIIKRFGFEINVNKTRLSTQYKRQIVTGLVVNSKVSIMKEYVKNTRAMALSLYTKGNFYIKGEKGTIKQLESRFSYINQIDKYNSLNDNQFNKESDRKNYFNFNSALSSREKQYQKFLFYKHFFYNDLPQIIVEGETDILYLKAALKKYHDKYPLLIKKIDDHFGYNFKFINKKGQLKFYFKLYDGGDSFARIYDSYSDTNPRFISNYHEIFTKYNLTSKQPLIMLFDNELELKDRPITGFLEHIVGLTKNTKKDKNKNPKKTKEISNYEKKLRENLYIENLNGTNLFVAVTPSLKDKEFTEIEDLILNIDSNNTKIEKASIVSGVILDKNNKSSLSTYIYNNYCEVDFINFLPLLDNINAIVAKYNKDLN